MLGDLPSEILEQIISHLPTASAVANLARTNSALYTKISAGDYAAFRPFVQERFPSISTPAAPLWRYAARVLTGRSRAWERRGIIARECTPARREAVSRASLAPVAKHGYIPVIDSYEDWTAGSRGRDVVAFGAAGRLRLRITDGDGSSRWQVWRTERDWAAENDIMDVKLLRPHQKPEGSREQILIRRADGEIVRVECGTATLDEGETEDGVPPDPFITKSSYATGSNHIDCMDVSNAAEPILAVCHAKTIQVFRVNGINNSDEAEEGEEDDGVALPAEVLHLDRQYDVKHRRRCARFLADNRLAIGVQLLDGSAPSPVEIYHVTPHGLAAGGRGMVLRPEQSPWISRNDQVVGRHCANTMAPLDATASLAGRPGEVFLSGWSDGVARLLDVRARESCVACFVDPVDDGQILSILPIGHERFFAGSHHNACLKAFDLRMPGAKVYSYLDALPRTASLSSSSSPAKPMYNDRQRRQQAQQQQQQPTLSPHEREINIFLSVPFPRQRRIWQPLLPTASAPPATDNRPPRYSRNKAMMTPPPRYRGPIYSLSAPSALSPTVYAGIENHVIQLDFACTDDAAAATIFQRPHHPGPTPCSQASTRAMDEVLALSCYERPRPGPRESTDPILLRKQVVGWPPPPSSTHTVVVDDSAEPGWDERWRLAAFARGPERGSGSWRVD